MSRRLSAAPKRFTDDQLNAIRATASLAALAEANGVEWDSRKSRPSSGDFWACCPFHAEKSASFHVNETRGFFNCFGCGAKGDAFKLAQMLHNCGFREAVTICAGGAVDAEPDPALVVAREARRREVEAEERRRRATNRATAVALWDPAQLMPAPQITRFLRERRKIRCYLGAADLRWHASAPLKPYDTVRAATRPAMVARISNAADEHIGTHLTFLARDGSDKLHRDGSRIVTGDHVGGFIRLHRFRDAVVVGEGIETTLSASDACGLPGLAAINSANLRSLVLPESVRRVVIAFDRDAKGIGELSAAALAQRLWADDLIVELLPPPVNFKDWNDAAQAGALPSVGVAA